jgi:hypothetical protein
MKSICPRCDKYWYEDELYGDTLKCGVAAEAEGAGVPVVCCPYFVESGEE